MTPEQTFSAVLVNGSLEDVRRPSCFTLDWWLTVPPGHSRGPCAARHVLRRRGLDVSRHSARGA